MKTRYVLLLLLLWPFVSFGQDKARDARLCYSSGQLPSATEKALQLAREEGFQQREFTSLNSCSYTIRVYFHIVRRTNGTGGQDVGVINTVMNNLNAAFSTQHINFLNIGNGEVRDDNLYDFDDFEFNSLVNGSYRRSDAINVYLLDDAATYDGGRAALGGNSLVVGGDFQATDPDQLLVPSLVVAHEMGHCLGLYHTFETTFGAERVDGSNCTAAGDLICDTPAQTPAFAFQENNSCAYTLNLQDPNGDTYNPDARNIMNYARPSCYLGLTNGQGTRMRNTIGLGIGFEDAVETTPVYTGGTYGYGFYTYPITGNAGISVSSSTPTISFILANYGRTTNYQWTFTNQSGSVSYSSNGRGANVTLGNGASITVTCNYSNSCGSGSVSFSCYNYSGGGFRMAAYPNPAGEDLTIAAVKSEDSDQAKFQDEGMAADKPVQDSDLIDIDASVQLVDKNNTVVREGKLVNGKLSFSVAELPNGIYYLHMTHEDKQIRKQIVVQH